MMWFFVGANSVETRSARTYVDAQCWEDATDRQPDATVARASPGVVLYRGEQEIANASHCPKGCYDKPSFAISIADKRSQYAK